MTRSTSGKPLRFVTSVYGKKYAGMLLTLLYSIHVSNPDAKVTIFWQDVSKHIRRLKEAFPNFEFIDTEYLVQGDIIDRISHKMLLWSQAASRHPNENLVFCDVDMLVRKDIGHFFNEGFDIAFTFKDELYPLNTGTFLAGASDATGSFFEEWHERTREIVGNNELKRIASSREYPYGGPDQMALYQLVNFERGKRHYEIVLRGHVFVGKAFPCTALNETNSRPVTDEMHIIHYKGGWHSILLEGAGFTSRRPKEQSWDMYLLYLRTYTEAVRYVGECLHRATSLDAYGIHIPFYLNKRFEESPALYKLFVIKEKILMPLRAWGERISRFASSRLSRRNTL